MLSRLTDNQRKIVQALRYGKLDLWEVAEITGLPPFTARGELRALRRRRLVAERQSWWMLTDEGYEWAWGDRQEQLA